MHVCFAVCVAINCSKPLMVNGSGVVVVGTNYSHGAVIEYRCKTGWSTPEPFAICLGPSWSNKYTPWCSGEYCCVFHVDWHMHAQEIELSTGQAVLLPKTNFVRFMTNFGRFMTFYDSLRNITAFEPKRGF